MTWHIGIVARGAHWVVERELAILGYQAFYPRLRRWISHARARVAAERPLLGPYLFVENFCRGGIIDGLRGFLINANGAPAVVDDEVVFDWRHRTMRGEFDLTIREIPIGALVMIIEGEFAETIARVTAVARGKITMVPRGASTHRVTRVGNISALDRQQLLDSDPRGRCIHPPGGLCLKSADPSR